MRQAAGGKPLCRDYCFSALRHRKRRAAQLTLPYILLSFLRYCTVMSCWYVTWSYCTTDSRTSKWNNNKMSLLGLVTKWQVPTYMTYTREKNILNVYAHIIISVSCAVSVFLLCVCPVCRKPRSKTKMHKNIIWFSSNK